MSFGPPPAGFGPPASTAPSWTAPTEVEQALFESKQRGDWGTYFATLASEPLYFLVDREMIDAKPGSTFPLYRHSGRERYWDLYTEGMLPPPVPHQVFDQHYLGWFAKTWTPRDPPMFVVNPGTPCEAYLPAQPPRFAEWSQYATSDAHSDKPLVRTLRMGGPLHGPVAHGLACGALLCAANRSLWNAMAWHGTGYIMERRRLREWWGVHNREEWQQQLHQLLECEASSRVWEFVLELRHSLARDFGGHVDASYWRDAAARVLRGRASEAVITPDGVTTDTRRASEVEAQIEGVQRLIGRITRYEARFRADGILGENRYVKSVAAWDLGRASKMARWGLGARFGTLPEAEKAVLTAGTYAERTYHSWQDFSAGYILGRCLHFDDEEFGSWYEDMLQCHHLLMSDPGSPWLNIPFR